MAAHGVQPYTSTNLLVQLARPARCFCSRAIVLRGEQVRTVGVLNGGDFAGDSKQPRFSCGLTKNSKALGLHAQSPGSVNQLLTLVSLISPAAIEDLI